jgi:hypothetical protein
MRKRILGFVFLAAVVSVGLLLARSDQVSVQETAGSIVETTVPTADMSRENRAIVLKESVQAIRSVDGSVPGVPDDIISFGENHEVKLEARKLNLTRVFSDGTTQYDYDHGEMTVTILPDGKVLLLPREI